MFKKFRMLIDFFKGKNIDEFCIFSTHKKIIKTKVNKIEPNRNCKLLH